MSALSFALSPSAAKVFEAWASGNIEYAALDDAVLICHCSREGKLAMPPSLLAEMLEAGWSYIVCCYPARAAARVQGYLNSPEPKPYREVLSKVQFVNSGWNDRMYWYMTKDNIVVIGTSNDEVDDYIHSHHL